MCASFDSAVITPRARRRPDWRTCTSSSSQSGWRTTKLHYTLLLRLLLLLPRASRMRPLLRGACRHPARGAAKIAACSTRCACGWLSPALTTSRRQGWKRPTSFRAYLDARTVSVSRAALFSTEFSFGRRLRRLRRRRFAACNAA